MFNLFFHDFAYHTKIDNHEQIKQKIFNQKYLSVLQDTLEWECKVKTSFKKTLIDDSIFSDIQLEIKKIVHEMLSKISPSSKISSIDFPKSNICMNLYNVGDYQDYHDHTNNKCNFSFCYFMNYNPEKDAKFVFFNEKFKMFRTQGLTDQLLFDLGIHDNIFPNVEEGHVIIFPSHYTHRTTIQQYDTNRCTVSGNFFVNV